MNLERPFFMQGTSSCIGLNLDSFTSSPVITQSSQFIHSAVDLYRLIYGAKLPQQITLSTHFNGLLGESLLNVHGK